MTDMYEPLLHRYTMQHAMAYMLIFFMNKRAYRRKFIKENKKGMKGRQKEYN